MIRALVEFDSPHCGAEYGAITNNTEGVERLLKESSGYLDEGTVITMNAADVEMIRIEGSHIYADIKRIIFED